MKETIIIGGKPIPQQRPTHFGGGVWIGQKERQAIRWTIRANRKTSHVYNRPVSVKMDFGFQRPKKPKWQVPAVRPDIDNLLKMYLDALLGFVLSDDSLVVELVARKIYVGDDSMSHVKITISELGEDG